MFAWLADRRREISPADRTIDGVYPEAALWADLGDPAAAVAWLDPTLNALADAPPDAFIEPGMAGALVRAMVLRADLAARQGGVQVRQWATPVLILWADGDDFLKPVIQRMKRIADSR
jgi:hypothetical protein